MDVFGFKTNKHPHRYFPAVLVICLAAIYWVTLTGLFKLWTKWDESLSHGLIIAGLTIALLTRSELWTTSNKLNQLQTKISLALVALFSMIWALCKLARIDIAEQLIFTCLIVLSFGALYGWRTTLQHKYIFALLLFCIPFWEFLVSPLVSLSSLVVGAAVKLIGIPAIVSGNSIFIPSGHIVIADGCSGIRYFQISLALSLIISILNNYQTPKTFTSLIIGAAIGLIANWIRIFVIVIAGHLTQMQSSLMHDHEYFGWAVFAALVLPAIYFAPVVETTTPENIHRKKPSVNLFLTILLCAAIGPAIYLSIQFTPEEHPIAAKLSNTEIHIHESEMPIPLIIFGSAKVESGGFLHPHVAVQVNHFQQRNAQEKLVPYLPRMYKNEDWNATKTRITFDNKSYAYTVFNHKQTERKVAQIQWFEIGSLHLDSTSKAKLLQPLAIAKGFSDFRVITLQAFCEDNDCDAAKKQILSKITKIEP